MRILPQHIKNVFFIGEIPVGGGDLKFGGTGFFVAVMGPKSDIPELQTWFVYTVTAKHVIEALKGSAGALRINLADGGTTIRPFSHSDWFFHPDPAVDVAVSPFDLETGFEIHEAVVLPIDQIITFEEVRAGVLAVGDELNAVGLFSKLSGLRKNLPIVRFGHLAMIPDEPVITKSGATDAMLLELTSIGGLSGSPVFFIPPLFHPDRRMMLVGIVHGHYDFRQNEVSQNFDRDRTGLGSDNAGVAVMIPGYRIVEVINSDDLRNMREAIIAREAGQRVGG